MVHHVSSVCALLLAMAVVRAKMVSVSAKKAGLVNHVESLHAPTSAHTRVSVIMVPVHVTKASLEKIVP